MKYSCLIIIMVLALTGLMGQSEQAFEKGNDAFKQNNYEAAISEYSKLVDKGLSSPELLYNLGTSYLHQNQIGKAVLYLEKAHLIKPSDRNIRHNLFIARDKVDTAVIEVPDFFPIRIWKSFSGLLNPWLWFVLSLITGGILVLGVYRWRLGLKDATKIKGFSTMIAGLMLLLLCHLAGRSSYNQQTDKSAAIVTVGTNLYDAADNRSEQLEALSEGVKVKILDEVDQWFMVSLSNKEVGWVSKESVNRIAL